MLIEFANKLSYPNDILFIYLFTFKWHALFTYYEYNQGWIQDNCDKKILKIWNNYMTS